MQKFRAPTLPAPPAQYDQSYLMQLVRTLGIYFDQIDSNTAIRSDTAQFTSIPQSSEYNNITFGSLYRGQTDDVVRVKVNGIPYSPLVNQAALDAAITTAEAQSAQYTDTVVANYLPLTGGVLSGDLTVQNLYANNISYTNITITNATIATLNGPTSVATGGSVIGTDPGSIAAPGTIIQVRTIRTGPDTIGISSTSPVNTGIELNFTPLKDSSTILIQAFVATSATYVNSLAIYKNGAPTVSTAGFGNNNQPDMQLTSYYGLSTPDQMYPQTVTHSEPAVNTNARLYSVFATSGWAGLAYATYINNRASGDMCSFSYMTIWEIAG